MFDNSYPRDRGDTESVPQLVSTEIPDWSPMLGRSPGPHVSEVIADLCMVMGLLETEDPTPYSEIPEDQRCRMKLGSAFETGLLGLMRQDQPDRIIVPPELCCDGIFGHPDLVLDQPGIILSQPTLLSIPVAVGEAKATWISARREITDNKFWKYWLQCSAYCYMLGIPTALLFVSFVNGEYEWHKLGVSKFRLWRRDFRPWELRENWDMILKHAGKMARRGVWNHCPPKTYEHLLRIESK